MRVTSRRFAVVPLACVVGGLALAAAVSAPAASRAGVSATFQPWGASFISPTTGFVLGGAGCRFQMGVQQRPCHPVLVAIADGGVSRQQRSAPATALAPFGVVGLAGPQVKAISFADARNGWLYGPGLWATHDGGRHWTRIVLEQQVSAIVAASGWAYATVGALRPTGALLRSPVGRDDWQPVATLPPTSDGVVARLATDGRTIRASLAPGQLRPSSTLELWRSRDGARWQHVSDPCPATTVLSIAASSPVDLVLSCGAQISTSTDGGAHISRLSGVGANLGPVAAPLGQSNVVVLASPYNFDDLSLPRGIKPMPTQLRRTTNAGRTWTRTTYNDHGAGFADLQFVSATVGWVVHGYPGGAADELLRTTDAGATFTPVRF